MNIESVTYILSRKNTNVPAEAFFPCKQDFVALTYLLSLSFGFDLLALNHLIARVGVCVCVCVRARECI